MQKGKIMDSAENRYQQLDQLFAENRLPEAEKKIKEWLEESRGYHNLFAEITWLNELAGLYRTTGRAREAAEAAERALAILMEVGGRGTEAHATTLINAATAHARAGEFEAALSQYEGAEAILTSLGLTGSYQMASLYNNVSRIYNENGDYGKALEFLQKAFAIIKNLKDCEAEAATTRVNMAYCRLETGDLAGAGEELEEAFRYYDGPEGVGDGHYAAALSAAAELRLRKGDPAGAVELYRKALSETLNRFGENDSCRIIRSNIARAEEEQRKKENA